MIRLAVLIAALFVALPVAAAPINLQCTIADKEGAAEYGRLAVEVDPDTRTVRIAAEKTPGARWEYRNVVGPRLVQIPQGADVSEDCPSRQPVNQFVEVTPRLVQMGWRSPDGKLRQLSTFNRSALSDPAMPCVWRRVIPF
jgi:hypothetical protein